jgi:5'-deoxynucleotidase YfbR-like HD superfamily hydrolase
MTAEQLGFLFRAFDVKRYHTLPLIREQTVGDHTARVLVVAFYLAEHTPSMELVSAILEHDGYEFFTGDIPATMKWFDGFGDHVEVAEKKIDEVFSLNYKSYELLTAEEKLLLKVADTTELCCRCSAEVMMGNRFLAPIFQVGAKYLDNLKKDMPVGMWEKIAAILGPRNQKVEQAPTIN